jgi:hypothetical protein
MEFATSTKIEALTEELVMMRRTSPGSKAIVFSQFVNMLDLIRWRLHSDPCLGNMGLGARALHGGMDVKARDAVLKDFREDPSVRVLLMSLKAGGVALNLTVANHIYLMDPWWNPAAEMQAIDRTHRLGTYYYSCMSLGWFRTLNLWLTLYIQCGQRFVFFVHPFFRSISPYPSGSFHCGKHCGRAHSAASREKASCL